MTRQQLIDGIVSATARMEGYYNPHSLAARNNNPGNLRSWGNLPISCGFVQFPTPEAGFAALSRQVGLLIDRRLTLYEFYGGKKGVYPGYAPDSDGNRSRHYAEFVARQVGISPDAVLAEVIS